MHAKPFTLALFEPDIAANTGAMLRTCACFGAEAALIEPAGFVYSDSRFRRAGMDYLDAVDLVRHASFAAFEDWRRREGRRLALLTTQGDVDLWDFRFQPGDVLMVGRELAGVPAQVHEAADARRADPDPRAAALAQRRRRGGDGAGRGDAADVAGLRLFGPRRRPSGKSAARAKNTSPSLSRGVEPDDVQVRIFRLESLRGPGRSRTRARRPASRWARASRTMRAHDVEPVLAADMRELRLGRIFRRKARRRGRLDIGRIGEDEVVARIRQPREQIALDKADALAEAVLLDIAPRHRQRVGREVDRVDGRVGKYARGEDGERAAAGAEIEHAPDALGLSRSARRRRRGRRTATRR